MTILVTNDDGYSEGLLVLLEAAKKIDSEVYSVVADKQRSAVSKAITLNEIVRAYNVKKDIMFFSGTPADIVLFSVYSKKVKKPDFVLSGINFGENTCLDAMLSSGTLAACWQAVLEDIPAIAFSMCTKPGTDWRNSSDWGDRRELKKHVMKIIRLLMKKCEKNCFYSVTLPDTLTNGTKIVFVNKVQKRRFRTEVHERSDPDGKPYYWLSGKGLTAQKGSDLYEATVKKNIVITRVSIDFVKKLV
jgi:5'-nucleotidase